MDRRIALKSTFTFLAAFAGLTKWGDSSTYAPPGLLPKQRTLRGVSESRQIPELWDDQALEALNEKCVSAVWVDTAVCFSKPTMLVIDRPIYFINCEFRGVTGLCLEHPKAFAQLCRIIGAKQ